jgi:hypothetical protein
MTACTLPKFVPCLAPILAIWLLPSICAAHPAPQAYSFSDSELTGVQIVTTSRGLAIQTSRNDDWRYICGESAGISSGERPDVYAAPNGDLLVATSRGLRRGDGDGCSWDLVDGPLSSATVQAMAIDASNPQLIWAVTASSDRENGLFRSEDSGQTWSLIDSVGSNAYLSSLAISPSHPERVCAVGFRISVETPIPKYFLRCIDGEESLEHPIETTQDDLDVSLLGIHSTDPNRVFVLVKRYESSPLPDRVLESADRGAGYREIFAAKRLTSFATTPDGLTIWIGGLEGIWSSQNEGRTFQKSPARMPFQCLKYSNESLWACSEHSVWAFALGVSTDGGRTFQARLRFEDINELPACSDQINAECHEDWVDWGAEILSDPPTVAGDVGVTPIGLDASQNTDQKWDAAGTDQETRSLEELGCNQSGPQDPSPPLWFVVCVATILSFSIRRPVKT